MSNEHGLHHAKRSVVVLALAGSITLGCSDAPSPVAPTGIALDSSGAALADSVALLGDPGLGPDLASVRRATARFHDVERAIEAGYANPLGGPCDINPGGPGIMGIHSPNQALTQSQALDPERPEVLLYLPKAGGGFRLIAVEYLQVALVRNRATRVVAPWFGEHRWDDAEYEQVTPTPQLFGQTFDGPMAGHVPGMPWHWDLHVWVWANNPSGMFAQWNPTLSCIAE